MTDTEQDHTDTTTIERVALLAAQANDDDMRTGIKRVVVVDRLDRMAAGRRCDSVALVEDTINATRDSLAVQIAGMILFAEGKAEHIERVDPNGPDPSTFDVATLHAVLDFVSLIPCEDIFAAIHELTQN